MADREVKLVYKISDEGTIRTLDEIRTKVKAVGEGVEVSTRQAGEGFNRFQTSVITASQAINIAQTAFNGFRQVVDGVTESIGRVDNYGELARAIGLSVDELTSMRVAAKQGGVELGELGRSVSFLQRELIRAAQGGGKAGIFEQLGISAKDLQEVQSGARSTVSVMADLGRAFEGLSKAQQVALSRELFGRGGGRLLNVLTSDLERQIGVARQLGAVISEDMAGAADEAANALDELSVASQSLQEAIGVALAPVVTDVAKQTTAWAVANREVITSDFTAWGASLKRVLSDDVLPFINSTIKELNALASAFDYVKNGVVSVDSSGVSVGPGGDWQTGTGRIQGGEINDRVREAGARARTRVVNVSGGAAGRGGGGGGSADSDRQAERQRLEEERRIIESLTERERIRVALAEREVTLRDNAVDRAKEDLDLAKEYGATEDQQIAMAQRLDELEQLRLVATRDRLRAELDGLLQFGPVIEDQVIEIETRLDTVDERISRGADSAERLRREFEKSKEAVDTIGDSLDRSLQRAVDGLLSGGGEFDLSNVLLGTSRALTSDLVGQAIKGFNFGKLFGGGSSSSVSGGGQFSDVSGGSSSTAPTGGGDSSGGLGGLGAAAASYGVTVALDLALNAQKRTKDLYNGTNLLRTTLDQGDIIYAAGGGGLVGGNGAAMARYDPMTRFFLDAFGFMQAPTGGTQRAMALEKILRSQGLPQQSVYGITENGIRAQFLTNAPNSASAAAFAAAGFGFDIPGLRQPTIEQLVTPGRNGATYASDPGRVGEALRLIEQAGRERPGVESLRTNEALGLGLVLSGGTRRGVNVANLLTNNLLLTGVSEGEARRQLKKIAESQGVTLGGGVEEAQRLFIEGRLRDNPNTPDRNEAKDQLFTAVEGLVGIFKDDIPAGVDVSAIALANFTEKAGIDIDAFNKQLERALEIFGQLKETTEGGLKTGLGASLAAFATRNGLIAGGGSIADIVKANNRGRAEVVSALFESISSGLSTAITEGVFDAVKETPAWDALSQAIANAVGGANIADLPQLIGGVITTALPALNAAAETISQIQAVIGVTPTSLDSRASSIGQRIENVRYGRLNPNQQEKFLRTRLSQIDAELATTNDPLKRRELLDERADIAFKGAELAGSRYAPGSAAGERAVNQWLLVAENTRQQFEEFSKDQLDQIDATKANTDATDKNTAAIDRQTELLKNNGATHTMVVLGDQEPLRGKPRREIRQFLDDYFTKGEASPAAQKAVREWTRK